MTMGIIPKSRYPGDPQGQTFAANMKSGWEVKAINGTDVLTKVREIENTGYLAAHKEYTEFIQAIADSIAELKGQSADAAQEGASASLGGCPS